MRPEDLTAHPRGIAVRGRCVVSKSLCHLASFHRNFNNLPSAFKIVLDEFVYGPSAAVGEVALNVEPRRLCQRCPAGKNLQPFGRVLYVGRGQPGFLDRLE